MKYGIWESGSKIPKEHKKSKNFKWNKTDKGSRLVLKKLKPSDNGKVQSKDIVLPYKVNRVPLPYPLTNKGQ